MVELEGETSNSNRSGTSTARKSTRAIVDLSGASVVRSKMAERQGFEPWRRSPAYTLSKRAPSTTRPPLRLLTSGGNPKLWNAIYLRSDALDNEPAQADIHTSRDRLQPSFCKLNILRTPLKFEGEISG